MDQGREYRIDAATEGGTHGVEYWRNTLQGGKHVDVAVHRVFERGLFTVNLTRAEKECIEKKDDVDLFAHGACCEEVWWGEVTQVEILSSDNDYTADERGKISALLNWHTTQVGDGNAHFDGESMDKNGWTLLETKYRIVNGCTVSE